MSHVLQRFSRFFTFLTFFYVFNVFFSIIRTYFTSVLETAKSAAVDGMAFQRRRARCDCCDRRAVRRRTNIDWCRRCWTRSTTTVTFDRSPITGNRSSSTFDCRWSKSSDSTKPTVVWRSNSISTWYTNCHAAPGLRLFIFALLYRQFSVYVCKVVYVRKSVIFIVNISNRIICSDGDIVDRQWTDRSLQWRRHDWCEWRGGRVQNYMKRHNTLSIWFM